MSAENLFTTSRIENVNQIIAELYDDSILLEKRMESFFLNLNNIVFFEKANFLFYQNKMTQYLCCLIIVKPRHTIRTASVKS